MSLRGWVTVLVLGMFLLGAPNDSQAKDEPVDKASTKAEKKAEGKNPLFPPAPDLTLWTIVIFVVLLLVLRKIAWGPMLEGLNKREETIRLSVEEAKLAREETERLRAQFKAEMDQAFAKIPAMMDEARRAGEKIAEEMRAKAAADIQADRQRAQRELEVAKDQALQELTNHVAQLATLVSAKAIGRSLSAADHGRLVDEALSEIRATGTK